MSNLKRRGFIKTGSLLTVGLLAGSAGASKEQAQMDDNTPAILEAIMNRRAVRNYQSTPIPKDHLKLILEAACMAPTAGNQQPWKFIVTTDSKIISKMKEMCITKTKEFLSNQEDITKTQLDEKMATTKEYYAKCFSAPVYVTILTDKESRYPTYNHWDGPLAAGNLMIAARALGYGTVHYTDSIPVDVTKEALNIPDQYERVCITPIGIPVEWPDTPQKNEYESFIVNNSF